MSKLWSDDLSGFEPYVPGEQPQIDNLTKLNTNESPYGPGPAVAKALGEFEADSLRLYPDPQSCLLRREIATYHKVSIEQVFVGNGSDEVLAHAFRAFFKKPFPLCFPDITYSFYPVYCKLFGINYRNIPLRGDYSLSLDDYPDENGGVIFANPNAPTGVLLALDELEAFLQKNEHSVVLVDEAYIDFAESGASAIALVDRYPNLLVTRTVSKSRALAGLRLGYAIGSAELIEGLTRVKDSFNSYPIDQLASAVTIASFSDEAYFRKTVAAVVEQRSVLASGLADQGFICLPSSANFIMAKPTTIPAPECAAALREVGIIVRYFDKPRLSEYLRITVGDEAQNKRLLDALKIVLS